MELNKKTKIKAENYVKVEGTPNKATFTFKGKKIQFNTFYISKYTVTNEEFCMFLNEVGNLKGGDGKPYYNGNTIKQHPETKKWEVVKGLEQIPAVFMSWYGAEAYCKWIGGDLPTEAQWEYSAKGGQKSENFKYSGSNNLKEVSHYIETSKGRLHKGGELKANELGLFDMSGNIWEWTADWYDETGKNTELSEGACDFKGACDGKRKVRKGGSAWCKPYTNEPKYQSKVLTSYYRHNQGIRPVFNIKKQNEDC